MSSCTVPLVSVDQFPFAARVAIRPRSPTATKRLLPAATPRSQFVKPVVSRVQFVPVLLV